MRVLLELPEGTTRVSPSLLTTVKISERPDVENELPSTSPSFFAPSAARHQAQSRNKQKCENLDSLLPIVYLGSDRDLSTRVCSS